MTTKRMVSVADIATGRETYAVCTGCHEHITVIRDDYGYWIECGCDAGYIDALRIEVL